MWYVKWNLSHSWAQSNYHHGQQNQLVMINRLLRTATRICKHEGLATRFWTDCFSSNPGSPGQGRLSTYWDLPEKRLAWLIYSIPLHILQTACSSRWNRPRPTCSPTLQSLPAITAQAVALNTPTQSVRETAVVHRLSAYNNKQKLCIEWDEILKRKVMINLPSQKGLNNLSLTARLPIGVYSLKKTRNV